MLGVMFRVRMVRVRVRVRVILEFSLGKLACEVFQCNHRPAH
jgi:hypothetical protein